MGWWLDGRAARSPRDLGTRRPDGSVFYRSGATRLRFFAQMDRNCSWWNPGEVGLPDDYILEHEQIHFALFELEARRLNESAAEIGEAVSVTADSKEEAARGAQEQLTALSFSLQEEDPGAWTDVNNETRRVGVVEDS